MSLNKLRRFGVQAGCGGRRHLLWPFIAPVAIGGWIASQAVMVGPGDLQPCPTQLGRLLAPGAASGFNVLIITLDTVRQDRIGCYGYPLARTPAIDALAARGVRFDEAVASVPITLPSHATIMTGIAPHRHGVRDNGRYRLADEHVTLAEQMRQHGYGTAAFVSCFVLDERFGLAQGFDEYNFQTSPSGFRRQLPDFNERGAGPVTDAALAWLRRRQEEGATTPFFLWVHYFDPHWPYQSPLAESGAFAGHPYDAEIAYVDQNIQRLVDHLARRSLLDRTLVILVADHGEGLGDHGETSHGLFLYETTLRVPFIISCPGLFEKAYRVPVRLVGLVDLRPTLEDLVGLPHVDPCDGFSLLTDSAGPTRAIYLETELPLNAFGWSPLFGLRTQGSKFILAPNPEFYCLGVDPQERVNLAGSRERETAALRLRLADLLAEGRDAGADRRPLSEEEIDRLRSLGYASVGGAGPDLLADPKQMLPVLEQFHRAEMYYCQGRFAEAAALAVEVVQACPTCSGAIRTLAFCYLRQGRAEEAIEILRESVHRRPDVYLVRSLAEVLILLERFDEVKDVLRLYEDLDSGDGRVSLLRGDVLWRQGQAAAALRLYREAAELDANRTGPLALERLAEVRHLTATP